MNGEKMVVRFTVAVILTVVLSALGAAGIEASQKAEYNITGKKPQTASETANEYIKLPFIMNFK